MTVELTTAKCSSTVEKASIEGPAVTPSGSNESLALKTKPNNTQLSFDPMQRSGTKRRISPETSASSETSKIDSTNAPQTHNNTQSNDDDIRKDVMPQTERKFFADLPDPTEDKMSPDAFLNKLVYATCGLELEPKKAKSLENFFAKVTDEQVAAYTITVVSACRTNDLDALKKLHTEEGQTMNCFNRFGESLLTMACRRGFEDIVEYLLESADVDVRISDDSGRTVLHDACWNPTPQLKICQWIMERDPALFFIADNRGCTPFQYARPEHWGIWRRFLLENKDTLQSLTNEDVKTKLSKA